jgi:hypothetical protein
VGIFRSIDRILRGRKMGRTAGKVHPPRTRADAARTKSSSPWVYARRASATRFLGMDLVHPHVLFAHGVETGLELRFGHPEPPGRLLEGDRADGHARGERGLHGGVADP